MTNRPQLGLIRQERQTRRRFVKRMTLATTGLSALVHAPRSAGADDPGKRAMRLSCSSINFSSLPIEQAVARIASLGFDAIDIWSAHAGCPHLDDCLNRLGHEGLTALLKKHRLDLYSFSVYAGGFAKYAGLLGGCGGGVAVQGSRGGNPKDIRNEMKAFLETLKPLAELAEKNNSFLAIENHSHALLDAPDSFKAFVDLNDNPRIGIALAPYHLQSWKADVAQVIRTCGDQLLYVYGWQKGSSTNQLPGIGPVDFKPLLAALKEVNFKYPLNPFLHHEPAPDETSAALRKSRAHLIRLASHL
jgi:sugar phosphate isomerase/epimerase